MGQKTDRRVRLNLTVTLPMAYALDDLAERSGMPVSTQATMLLRQALDRTMQTDRVQQRLREHYAQRTLQQSQTERMTEHAVETTYAKEAHDLAAYTAADAKAKATF